MIMKEMNSNISALVDDEICDPKIIDDVLSHDELKQSVLHYYMIRDCMDHSIIPHTIDHRRDILAGVKQGIHDVSVEKPIIAWHSFIFQPLTKVALAASLMVAVIIGIYYDDESSAVAITKHSAPVKEVNTASPSEYINHYLVNYSQYRSHPNIYKVMPYSARATTLDIRN